MPRCIPTQKRQTGVVSGGGDRRQTGNAAAQRQQEADVITGVVVRTADLEYLFWACGGFWVQGALLVLLSFTALRVTCFCFTLLTKFWMASGSGLIECIGLLFQVIGALVWGIAGAAALWFAYGLFIFYGFQILVENGLNDFLYASLAVAHIRP